MDPDESAKLVRELRERLDLTQEQFAQRIGVTYSTVNHWENGKRTPQPFLLERLRELQEEIETGSGEPARARAPERVSGVAESSPVWEATNAPPSSRMDTRIKEMVDRIVERFDPEKVILFGSHGRGEAAPDRDVDLLIIMEVEGPKRAAQLRIREELHDIRLPKDVIVSTPDEFGWRQEVVGTIEAQAAEEGQVLYERG